MQRRILLIVYAMFCFQISISFSQQISFNRIPFQPENDVITFTDIKQDHLGFIWITSFRGGIFRYDGTEFVNFKHSDTNSNSLSNDFAQCLFVDSTNNIWIGTTGGGLDRFDPVKNQFTHFRHDPKNINSLANDSVVALLIDKAGNFWVGTRGGLDLLDRKKETFKHYTHKENDPSSISNNYIRIIYQDHQGTIWIGSGNPLEISDNRNTEGGLNRFDPVKGVFTRYMHDPANPNSIESNIVKAVFEDSKGNFWVGTSGDGLHIMDRTKGTFRHYFYDPAHPENLSRPPLNHFDLITFINEDIFGGIWIGSYNGINRYDPVSKKIIHFGIAMDSTGKNVMRKDTTTGLTDTRYWKGLFLKEGVIWIITEEPTSGTYLYKANLSNKKIPYFPISKPNANSFYQEDDSTLWIGTDSGLLIKNTRTQAERLYTVDPKSRLHSSNGAISYIRVDWDKNFWLGTYGGGLIKWNEQTKSFTHFRFNPNDPFTLRNDTIYSLCLDHNGDLWIGTAGGLDKKERNSDRFTHIKLNGDISSGKSDSVLCIREDHDNGLWVGGKGLYHVNITNNKADVIFSKGLTFSICVDKDNVVWVDADTAVNGSQDFLYRYDRNRKQLYSFLEPGSQKRIHLALDILEDNNGELWVTSRDAIYKINKNRDLVRIYGVNNGVHRINIGYWDNYRAKDGKLFIGDQSGYYSFYPDELKDNAPPILNFTSFKLNGKEVVPGESEILKMPVWQTDEINLHHNQNSFSFDFIGIEYQAEGAVNYLYMLENYDGAWHKYGSEHQAYYYNLLPGKYIFHVKAINENGDSAEKMMSVVISPPWWKTWWAYTLFGLLCAGGIWRFIDYRSKKLKNENKLLEEKITQRTKELTQSLEKLKSTQSQLVQSEKMASLGELTAGIAHEIQNPLNFVNNFSEVNKELLIEMKDEMDRGNMAEVKSIANDLIENEEKISHHGKRADSIVKGMLQHSRTSTGKKEPADINAMADEYLRLAYHGIRANDKGFNVTMKSDFDPIIGVINIIPQDIGRVLLNLYNNAFYAVAEKKKLRPDGYEPAVSLSTKKIAGRVEIRVRDNGNGIPQKVIDKIFQPFFTTKPPGQGTGLGLSLSYDIVKAHGGEIKVNTKEGEFTEFVVTLPA